MLAAAAAHRTMISPSREERGVEMSNPIHGEDDPERGRRPSGEAAGAVKDYIKDEVKGKAEGLFASISVDDLVDTPGSTQVLAQIFIFFARSSRCRCMTCAGQVVPVPARGPVPAARHRGLPVPSACVTTAQVLVAPAPIARHVRRRVRRAAALQHHGRDPAHHRARDRAPALLSALSIGIGVPTGAAG